MQIKLQWNTWGEASSLEGYYRVFGRMESDERGTVYASFVIDNGFVDNLVELAYDSTSEFQDVLNKARQVCQSHFDERIKKIKKFFEINGI